jgi:hypothetical protein
LPIPPELTYVEAMLIAAVHVVMSVEQCGLDP